MCDDIKQKVIEIVQEVFGLFVDIDDDEDFISRSYADSLDVVEFAVELEKEFGIEIEDKDIVKLNTINKTIYYLENDQQLPNDSVSFLLGIKNWLNKKMNIFFK